MVVPMSVINVEVVQLLKGRKCELDSGNDVVWASEISGMMKVRKKELEGCSIVIVLWSWFYRHG